MTAIINDFSAIRSAVDGVPAAGEDADLLAAARKIAALQEREATIYREYAGRMTMEIEQRLVIDALDPDRFAAEAIIYATPPQTLAGAAVKLRAIAAYCDDAAVGEGDVASLRQVLALIERAAQS